MDAHGAAFSRIGADGSAMKPRVFIAMASGILGGPGKGLAQFFRSGGLEGCDPLMAAYNRQQDDEDTEFIREMRATGVPLAVLRQRKTLDASLVSQALALVREHKSALLQSHGYKSHVLCWLLHRQTGLPWVAFVHGWTSENLKIRLYNLLEHVMLLFADEVVAVSASVKQRLLPPVRRKCIVIPNAVAEEELNGDPSDMPACDIRAELGIAPQALVVGVVGRLSPEKGHMVLLRALAQAGRQGVDLHALLVGQGQERERLHEGARALGLEKRCFFTGHVRGLAPYYRAMDMLALPSYSEGMPNAALEGMIMGLPVIASAVGGVPEVVRHGATGLLVPAGDSAALAGALITLANDPVLRGNMGTAGRSAVVAAHSPEKRARSMCALYHKRLSPSSDKEKV